MAAGARDCIARMGVASTEEEEEEEWNTAAAAAGATPHRKSVKVTLPGTTTTTFVGMRKERTRCDVGYHIAVGRRPTYVRTRESGKEGGKGVETKKNWSGMAAAAVF